MKVVVRDQVREERLAPGRGECAGPSELADGDPRVAGAEDRRSILGDHEGRPELDRIEGVDRSGEALGVVAEVEGGGAGREDLDHPIGDAAIRLGLELEGDADGLAEADEEAEDLRRRHPLHHVVAAEGDAEERAAELVAGEGRGRRGVDLATDHQRRRAAGPGEDLRVVAGVQVDVGLGDAERLGEALGDGGDARDAGERAPAQDHLGGLGDAGDLGEVGEALAEEVHRRDRRVLARGEGRERVLAGDRQRPGLGHQGVALAAGGDRLRIDDLEDRRAGVGAAELLGRVEEALEAGDEGRVGLAGAVPEAALADREPVGGDAGDPGRVGLLGPALADQELGEAGEGGDVGGVLAEELAEEADRHPRLAEVGVDLGELPEAADSLVGLAALDQEAEDRDPLAEAADRRGQAIGGEERRAGVVAAAAGVDVVLDRGLAVVGALAGLAEEVVEGGDPLR
ncbi:MAG: hypothetical protein R3B09_34955 [Nannocystaceae bacterium]